MQKLCYCILNNTTHFIAKIDPLKYLMSKASLTSQVEKWVFILSEFDIIYKDRKAIKGRVIVGQLGKPPLQGDHPILVDFIDEKIMTITPSTPWKLFFDGSFTQNGSGGGILFVTLQ